MKMVMRKYSEKELRKLFDDNEDDIIMYLATDGRYFEEEDYPDLDYDEYYDDY